MRKIVPTLAVLLGVFLLSGCGAMGEAGGDTPSEATSVENSSFQEKAIKLTDDISVLCLTRGSGKSAVISCMIPEKPLENAIPVSESGYDLRYYKSSLGDTLACLERSLSSRSAQFACVKIVR